MSRQKRITNEINKFLISGKEDELGCWLINHDDSDMIFYMYLSEDKYVTIKINYPRDYPFKAPKVFINNHDYISLLRIEEKWKLDFLGPDKCLCCSSMTCANNWCAARTTFQLLDEIKNNLTFKIRLNEIAHVRKIRDKYLIDDIPLENFL